MKNEGRWVRFEADGTEWEARMVAASERSDADRNGEVIEFVCVDGTRSSRRVAGTTSVTDMDERSLRSAYRQARPVGGDRGGLPGQPTFDSP